MHQPVDFIDQSYPHHVCLSSEVYLWSQADA
jgi:hypothetical protein